MADRSVLAARRCCAGWLLVLLVAGATGLGRAQEFGLESAGVRVGGSFTSTDHDFHQAEAFVNWNLPWTWDVGAKWWLKPRVDLSAGWLGDPGASAAVGTLGLSLVLGHGYFPLTLEGGISPTLLSRHDFGTKNFGINFQFTSHAGLNYDLTPHVRLGYRFQHMSNADLRSCNPGLNLHMLVLGYVF